MHWLETKVPPDAVMILLGMVAFTVARLAPVLSFELPLQIPLAVVIGFAGLALIVLAKITFHRLGATEDTHRPASSNCLVTSGVYRYTRNPMYLGHAIILLGWAFYLANFAALAAVPAFILYISRFQIQPEERQLTARFPEAYAAFFRQAPRWL